ncbi:MAG: peptidoglycan DD-metalloendopeptidase family protein [Patescibacteria group bacterium]
MTKTKIIAIAAAFMLLPSIIFAQTVDELNDQIKNKQTEINDIKKKTAIYQKNIRIKQEEAASLKNELSILENKIAKTKLDIKSTETEIDKTKLEIRGNELNILSAEDTIDSHKNSLADTLQEIHKSDEENAIKIFLLNNSLSDFINNVEYTKDLQNGLQSTLQEIKAKKKELIKKKEELNSKQTELDSLKQELDIIKIELTGETTYKEDLLVKTKSSEQKFSTLYWQAKKEEENIDAEIKKLENAARTKLDQLKKDKPQLSDATLEWPVVKNTITAYFHDPDYPFRYIFEHPAIDIRAKQGSPIKAAADGYVLKAKNGGMGYSYIALIHANGISTVYGHTSKIVVKDDEFVGKGEIIGYVGGTPGTPGAGRLTTGPHLHFEVRVNGIPVNALDYLP